MDAITVQARIRLAIKLALAAAIYVPILGILWPLFFGRPDFAAICDWLKDQHLAPGVHEGIELPFPHAHCADGGKVDVVISNDGEITILLKTHVGWKQNYQGYVYSTQSLGFWGDYYGRACILFTEHEQPVVSRVIDDQT
ncbi:MAG: hypothetical protein DCC68_26155 [Planctomycetota bacterium]|nr:MAG: hypothetical protein DCC68_26155 [Planctomycetota bacterium]